MNPDELIICKSCGKPLPLAEFPSHIRAKSGHLSICKVCQGKRISNGRLAIPPTIQINKFLTRNSQNRLRES